VAFGDPLYPSLGLEGAGGTDPELRSASLRGLRLAPLPSARREVEELGALYGRDAVLNLGAQATEERAKALDRRARYVHFACHGRIDERFPLNSALVLTIPDGQKEGRENGLLQAWEIFEQVRLDADLVTLSSCESALGTEMGGEGLLGLARAFQFAGARSVLASLWAVSDRSTADLMKSLYGQLKAGKSKDEALRSAQLAAIRAARTSHPFYWAAFQLIGDWK